MRKQGEICKISLMDRNLQEIPFWQNRPIEKDSIIGAIGIASKNIPSYSIAVGNLAKIIKIS